MVGKVHSRISRSSTGYHVGGELVEENTEAVTIHDHVRNVVLEITPYPGSGLAQVATMTPEQSLKISEYLKKHSKWLIDLDRPDLVLDMTYVPERSWNKGTLHKIPPGSAVFPILELATVPLRHVKDYLS